jgi:hypothetical protein
MTSAIVGTILMAINHGPAILAGDITGERLLQILLTFLVPYTVSTVSSVATRHEIRRVSHTKLQPEKRLYDAAESV